MSERTSGSMKKPSPMPSSTAIRERLASKPSGYSFVTRVLRAGRVVELTGKTQ